jgi:hypothetical protein
MERGLDICWPPSAYFTGRIEQSTIPPKIHKRRSG